MKNRAEVSYPFDLSKGYVNVIPNNRVSEPVESLTFHRWCDALVAHHSVELVGDEIHVYLSPKIKKTSQETQKGRVNHYCFLDHGLHLRLANSEI